MQSAGPTAIARASILCVQPNSDFHTALRVALASHELTVVSSALEALRALNASPFDAYVIDYWLPDWGGVSLCRHINDIDPHVPVCFFTAADSLPSQQRAMRAGAQAYLRAPEQAGQLSDELLRLFQQSAVRSMRAKIAQETAVEAELEKRAVRAAGEMEHAPGRPVGAMERAARNRAQKVFVEAGGTLAHFVRWWPQSFSSVLAKHRVSNPTGANAAARREQSDRP
jgi:DNA-binding NtrC family response regulator